MHWIQLYLPSNHSFKQNSQVLLYPVVLRVAACLMSLPYPINQCALCSQQTF